MSSNWPIKTIGAPRTKAMPKHGNDLGMHAHRDGICEDHEVGICPSPSLLH